MYLLFASHRWTRIGMLFRMTRKNHAVRRLHTLDNFSGSTHTSGIRNSLNRPHKRVTKKLINSKYCARVVPSHGSMIILAHKEAGGRTWVKKSTPSARGPLLGPGAAAWRAAPPSLTPVLHTFPYHTAAPFPPNAAAWTPARSATAPIIPSTRRPAHSAHPSRVPTMPPSCFHSLLARPPLPFGR